MTKKPTQPSATIDALDLKLAELEAEARALNAERSDAKRRHDNARAWVVTLNSHRLAGEDVTAQLAEAEKAEADAREDALAAADRDWASELEAIDGAIRQVKVQRVHAVTANAAPLIDELHPQAENAAARILDAAAELSAAISAHQSVMGQAEQVLRHLDWYDPRKDIPASGGEFTALRRTLDILQREGVPWPLPDLSKPPRKVAFLSGADQAAYTPPAQAA